LTIYTLSLHDALPISADEARRDEMRECTPSRADARALARHHALIPVQREILADLLTPVRAYALLCPPGQPGFLLESVEGGERLRSEEHTSELQSLAYL